MAQKGKNIQVNNSANIDYDKISDAVKRGIIEATQEQKPKDNGTVKEIKKISIFRLMFARKSEIVSSRGTSAFLQLCMTIILCIVQVMLVFLIAGAVYATWKTWFSIVNMSLSIVVIAVSCLLIGLLRVVRIEIENEQDQKYLLNLSASFASIFALIVAVIALFIRR